MCCPYSHCGWLLKGSAVGIGFNGAETNCRIAHILGILYWWTVAIQSGQICFFLATTIICSLSALNIIQNVTLTWLQNSKCKITVLIEAHTQKKLSFNSEILEKTIRMRTWEEMTYQWILKYFHFCSLKMKVKVTMKRNFL